MFTKQALPEVEIFLQGQGVFLMVAVDGDSDGLAPLDDGDGGIGISGNAFTPVSYTHLDVYKRQPCSGARASGPCPWSLFWE